MVFTNCREARGESGHLRLTRTKPDLKNWISLSLSHKFVNLLLNNATSKVCMLYNCAGIYENASCGHTKAILQSRSVVSKLVSIFTFDNVHC